MRGCVRVAIISAVKTYLGFYVFLALVVEGTLGALAFKDSTALLNSVFKLCLALPFIFFLSGIQPIPIIMSGNEFDINNLHY